MKIILTVSLLMSLSWAEARGLSAIRGPEESAQTARIRVSKHPIPELSRLMQIATPDSLSQALKNLNVNEIPEVSSAAELQREFNYLRDTRFLESDRPDFPRRITWLFPDDGCYARAEMAAIELEHHQFLAPKKIFSFGDLSVQTQNALTGSVTWWYHVAVAYRIQQDVYIFSPAISPRQPIRLKEWDERMGGAQTEIKYTLCSARTFDPDADCLHPVVTSDRDVEEEQKGYFKVEWTRVLKLNRDPEKELGDLPPWI